MDAMKTVPPYEYVTLMNALIESTHPGLHAQPVTFALTGTALEQRTALSIPRAILSAAASSVFDLRQQGIFCFPVLASLDEQPLL